jgi:nucleoside-diphosphate-sugar epimerase
VLVAGATGVIGRPVVHKLVAAGHEVTGMSRSSRGAGWLRQAGAAGIVCDALDADAVKRAFEEAHPEVVVNELTSLPENPNPRKLKTELEANDHLRRVGTANLATAAAESGARRLVSQSIAFAYEPGGEGVRTEEDPLDLNVGGPFRRTVEAIAELERLTLGTPGVAGAVLRYGWFYGRGTAFAADGAVAAAVRGRKIPVAGDGGGVRSFVHVEDAADATVAAVESDATGTFNVVDDDPAPLREWLPHYADVIGAPAPRRAPRILVRLVAGAFVADQLTRARGASNRAARETLRWTPSHASWREGFAEER